MLKRIVKIRINKRLNKLKNIKYKIVSSTT
jgi:hypothetical protein